MREVYDFGPEHDNDLLLPAEVAGMFGVDVKTVTRWDRTGRFEHTRRTLGGHRRYDRREVENMINARAHEVRRYR